jgi:hypothetical protein
VAAGRTGIARLIVVDDGHIEHRERRRSVPGDERAVGAGAVDVRRGERIVLGAARHLERGVDGAQQVIGRGIVPRLHEDARGSREGHQVGPGEQPRRGHVAELVDRSVQVRRVPDTRGGLERLARR